MNYYEQFYDDLEFCDPDDDPYQRRGYHHYGDDPYYHDDPYDNFDPYTPEAAHSFRDYRDFDHGRNYMDRGRFLPDRQASGSRGRGCWVEGSRGRGYEPERTQNRSRGGRGRGRGRGQIFDHGIQSRETFVNSRGQGNEMRTSDSQRGRARGNMWQRNSRGGMKGVNFIKAGSDNSAAVSNDSSKQEPNKKASESDQIRFDYKKYQNQPSETEKELEQAMEAYTCQLGFGYGYGPRDDLIQGDKPEWMKGSESGNQPDCQITENVATQENETTPDNNPRTDVKTAMVSPALNFVKAKSEFHSIDVAFHETEIQTPKPNSLSVNFGNKRVGLGFGVSANKSTASSADLSTEYHAGLKDGCNPKVDTKFRNLKEAIKARTLPNKNAIEILHMAVDKVKMKISDDVGVGNRTPNGQAMFLCRLEIEGVYISQGQATTKKAAKHSAYQNGLEVFNHEALTVKETSPGVFELKQKEPEFKVPFVAGQLGKVSVKDREKTQFMPGQKNQVGTIASAQSTSKYGQTAQSGKSVTQSASESATQSTYNKPKIVFHQPTHPLNNRPLEFKQNESSLTGSQFQQSGSPEALATKLLNFVKESSDFDKQPQRSNTGTVCGQNRNSDALNINRNLMPPQDSRKRPASKNFNAGKLKVQKKGGNVSHSIDDLSQFILIDNTPLAHTANELAMLHNSANFNRVILKLEYENDSNGVRCSLLLSDIIVTTTNGPTKEEAKQMAATDSLKILRDCCYTIKIKQAVDSDASGLTKEQLFSDIQQSGGSGGNAIPDSNIGNMLLRKMGWVGGGCGKDGKGIAEPVKAEMIIGREGLGLSAERGVGKNFHEKVTKMLQDYIKSDEQKDLHFSSELLKEERAIIHQIGQKLGLKTNSKGKNENRYLIVSRKRSARELLEHVRESGGSTSKYELIPPADSDYDIIRPEDIVHGHSKQ